MVCATPLLPAQAAELRHPIAVDVGRWEELDGGHDAMVATYGVHAESFYESVAVAAEAPAAGGSLAAVVSPTYATATATERRGQPSGPGGLGPDLGYAAATAAEVRDGPPRVAVLPPRARHGGNLPPPIGPAPGTASNTAPPRWPLPGGAEEAGLVHDSTAPVDRASTPPPPIPPRSGAH